MTLSFALATVQADDATHSRARGCTNARTRTKIYIHTFAIPPQFAYGFYMYMKNLSERNKRRENNKFRMLKTWNDERIVEIYMKIKNKPMQTRRNQKWIYEVMYECAVCCGTVIIVTIFINLYSVAKWRRASHHFSEWTTTTEQKNTKKKHVMHKTTRSVSIEIVHPF